MQRFLILLLLCFIALCAGLYIGSPDRQLAIGSFSFASVQRPEAEIVPVEKDKIRFVGDVMLARNVETLMDKYGSDYPYTFLPKQPQAAYLVGNFEAAIPKVHVPTPSLTFAFSVNPVHLQGLMSYGFTHVGLSNNHSYDFGADGFENTLLMLHASGLETFGDQSDLATSSITYIDLGTTTVALVGVYAVHDMPSDTSITAVLETASKASDVQIAFVHWGEEYKLVHNAFQEKLAHKLIDNGADAVIGHHPHVVQDIGSYQDRPIFYSLGNFIFDQYFSEDVETGLAVDLSLHNSGMVFDLSPISSIGSRSTPRFMAGDERNALLQTLAKKSEPAWQEMIKNGFIEVSFAP